jgi:dephospho-CoA kinase
MMRIAFAGKFYSGKSTCAQYADATYDMVLWSFGDYVRNELIESGEATKEEVYAARKSEAVRIKLQTLGEARREENPDYWVNQLLSDIDTIDIEDICVDDMRYENEAEALRDAGFKLVYVECTNLLDPDDPKRDHESEHGLDNWMEWDGVIVADHGNYESLYEQVDQYVGRWDR